MSDTPTLQGALVACKATLLALTPTKCEEVKAEYESAPHTTVLSIIDRIAEDSPSMGPAAFDDATLQKHLLDGAVVVLSTAIGQREESLLAGVLPQLSRLAIVRTDPCHHAAWARKILELSNEDCMHIAEPATMRAVLTTLRHAKPTKKEFVN